MFLLASKLFWGIVAPVQALLFVSFLGVAAGRWSRFGRWAAVLASASLIVVALLPVGVMLLRPLENRFPRLPADAPAPTGVIILGGPIDSQISAVRDEVAVGNNAGRLIEAAILARRYPQARIVYTGGPNALAASWPSEAAFGKKLLVSLGVDGSRIETETRSHTTDQNARFTRDLVSPKPSETWLLVTSAMHMPRSMGAFRRAGFNVVADPVDFRSAGDYVDWRLNQGAPVGLRDFDDAIHEWIGLVAYWLAGKSDDWFPGPKATQS